MKRYQFFLIVGLLAQIQSNTEPNAIIGSAIGVLGSMLLGFGLYYWWTDLKN